VKVALINSNRFKHPWPVIPFGLCCIAAALENEGHGVQVLDLCFSRNPANDIHSTIENFRPDVVGISIRNIDNAGAYKTQFLLPQVNEEVITPCKEVFSGPIVIGGPAVGISGIQMLHFFDLPFAICGDGEAAMVEFVGRLARKLPLDGIGGLVRREGGKIVEENPPLRIKDLDKLPFVRFQRYIDLRLYRRYNSPLQIQTKRGCALQCSYCTYNRIEGREYRLRTPQQVADDIERMVSETGINHIEFTDSTFNMPLDHAKAVLRALIEKGLDLNCRTLGLNPGAVDEELVDLMKKAGFQDVDLGIESGCDAMLRSLGKRFTKDAILQAGRLLHEKNIPICWCLLLGAPGETEETLRETFETITRASSAWDLVAIGVGIRVYNGAPIAEQMKQENPACTADDFLSPVGYSPETLDLITIKMITKRFFFRNLNFVIIDEDDLLPDAVMKAVYAVKRLFAPRQPNWKMYLLKRRLQKYTGSSTIASLIFDLKHRKLLSELKQKRKEATAGGVDDLV